MAELLRGTALGTAEDVAGGESPRRPWRSRLLALAQALLLLALVLLILWPRPAWGVAAVGSAAAAADGSAAAVADGASLFDLHCAGCHPNGGNIIRRGRTLREAALRRRGIEGPEAVAAIAAAGIGGMDGYAAVLGDGGPERVGAWVWQQALEDWPRRRPQESVGEPASAPAELDASAASVTARP